MSVWELDFYRRPLQTEDGVVLWELLICDPETGFRHQVFCPQPQVSADWLVDQLRQLATAGHSLPDEIHGFRPQTLNLLELVGQALGVTIVPTRRTPTLKRWLEQRSQEYRVLPEYTRQPYQPLNLEELPPAPLPENLWGDRWRFAALPAGDLVEAFEGRMIPILEMPADLLPLKLGIASTVLIPGIVIDGGRRSLRLAQWLQQARPVSLNYIAGAPDGLILSAGLVDRWVVATFEDADVKAAAQTYEGRKQASQGLHFLLVQPDESGMTYSGFWLLKAED